MKSLQLLFCAAFLLALISASSDKTDETKYFSLVKCAELFGKCLLKISEKSNVVSAPMQLNRVRRSFMSSGKCAEGQIWYLYKCFDCKEYVELTGKEC